MSTSSTLDRMVARRSLKVDIPTHDRLDALRAKGETYGDVIKRLLDGRNDARVIMIGPAGGGGRDDSTGATA